MPMTPKQMEKLLLKNGFIFDRQKGSHRIFFNPESKRSAIVPMHSKDLKKVQNRKFLKKQG